ncbi:MAG: M48 family metallopeptidase [Candidatus Tantalella remota]|nr:M48 family metallopeptidase [Candidatus Tantalella remota]
MARSVTVDIDNVGLVLLEKSKRAKYLSIFVAPFKGVRVAIPYGISFEEAEKAVRDKVKWVRKQLAKMRKFEEECCLVRSSEGAKDRREARKKLISRLEELALRYGFSYNRVFIREQKTRWGSCSTANNINLNVKLAELPDELSDYVMVHELMHTRIKDHQRQFWAELDVIFGNARAIDKKLRKYHLEML